MQTKYQVILMGDKVSFIDSIRETLYRHIEDLGLRKESVLIIDEANFQSDYKKNAPTFCLYFGNKQKKFKNLDLLDALIKNVTLILPVVDNLTTFGESIPEVLKNINGFELDAASKVEQLVACILEGLSLLRLSRRLFISYKRDESSAVAIQLFERLEKQGFDVFLDTHSIRPGEPFQEELWQRLADTDVVVLLNTAGFLQSKWTTEELAKANAMAIGILQLIWPSHKMEREAEISVPYPLKDPDFDGAILSEATVKALVAQIESLRARSLAARRDNIIKEFFAANPKPFSLALQPEKYIIARNDEDNKYLFITAVGVPQALTYYQSEEFVQKLEQLAVQGIFLVYDHRNIRDKWLKHLAWLDTYLPIKSIKILEAAQWPTKI